MTTKPAWNPTDHPIINSAYEEPRWHWKLNEQGVAQPELLPGRRQSIGVNPPVPRSKTPKMLTLFDDPKEELILVNNLRTDVSMWRRQEYPGVTNVTKQLLDHWNSDQVKPQLFFAQIEAIETLIYLAEIAGNNSEPRRMLKEVNHKYNADMRRMAVKMATGTGKTAVMALTIIWQSINRAHSPQDRKFTDRFAVLTPGITVRDRNQQDLIPNRNPNIYRNWNLIPNRKNMRTPVENARVTVTNFHTLQMKEIAWGQASSRARRLARMEMPTENGEEMIRRALKELDGQARIMVMNDEGHHCHNTNPELVEVQQEDRKTADLWFNGIREIQKAKRLHSVIDFSATPMFIMRNGFGTSDKIFPWTVSDFPLTDAIEAGMVKIPRIPVEDDTKTPRDPVYRNLYANSAGKTKQSSSNLTSPLGPALNTMYQQYLENAKDWKQSRIPPVFIIVANDIPNAQAIYEHVSGYRPQEDHPWEPGQLDEFSNVDPTTRELRTPPRTILVHSRLDQEEKITGTFSKTLKLQSDAFRRAMPTHPWPKDDKDVLREVMNTVGKENKPGEQVRCVVSVAMLTEGWDARTVTNVVGFRRFGTQLLCEQVAGRSLRRVNYEERDEDGFFTPEYADIMGIPFEFTFKATNGKTKPPVDTYEIRPIEERGLYHIQWPNLTGYRTERNGNGKLEIDWEQFPLVTIASTTPSIHEMGAIMGVSELWETEKERVNTAIFKIATELVKRIEDGTDEVIHRTELFQSALQIVRIGLRNGRITVIGGNLQALSEDEHQIRIANQLAQACRRKTAEEKPEVKAIVNAPIFYTTQEITAYRSSRLDWLQTKKSQMNIAPCDNGWELQVARMLDQHPDVTAWARNDRQRWQISYMYEGQWANYEPDFIAKVQQTEGILNLIIEVKGREWLRDPEKRRYTQEYWVPAVNGNPELNQHGPWDYLYVDNPGKAQMQITQVAGGKQW